MITFSQPPRGHAQKKVLIYLLLFATLVPAILFLTGNCPDSQLGTDSASAAAIVNTNKTSTEVTSQPKNQEPQTAYLPALPAEDESMSALKSEVNTVINIYKSQGVVKDASAFILKLNNDQWTGVNINERFAPGSMLKITILMTYMKMQENNLTLFDKSLYLDPRLIPNKTQHINETHLKPGHYTIRQLLYAMIANSDNYATLLLNHNIDNKIFSQFYVDLGLVKPDLQQNFYPMSTIEFSRFLRVLYNGTYINRKNADNSLDLLTKTTFSDGIQAGIPTGVKIAHKFGESGDGNMFELHESAIVYTDKVPYLLVIMSRGPQIQSLPAVLKDISAVVYKKLAVNS